MRPGTVLVEGFAAGLVVGVGWEVEFAAGELGVLGVGEEFADEDFLPGGIDGDVAEVEEGVDVGAEKQAVGGVVGVLAPVRCDVGGLEGVGRIR